MTYCVGVKLDEGLIFASDSRTHAGMDNHAGFCKMTVFERPGDRVLVLLSSGGLAATQTVINILRQRAAAHLERRLDVRRRQPKLHPRVVPQGPPAPAQAATEAAAAAECEVETAQARPHRISWARLLKRVLAST